jgi:DNA modification methylase
MKTLPLYNEDCIGFMITIKTSSVDLIVADYPFNTQDGRDNYLDFVKSTAIAFERIIKPGGNLLVVNNPHNIYKTANYYKEKGFELRNGVALIRKGSLRPAWHLGFQHNYALMLYSTKANGTSKDKWNGATKNHDKSFPTDVVEYQNGYRAKGAWHPQALPLDLVKQFVLLMSNEGDLVFDPFMGSGTTAIACMQTNRRWIGCEYNEKYYHQGTNRIYMEL